MAKIPVIIEKTDSGYLGRINIEDNLIVVEEKSLSKVESKIKRLLKEFHEVQTETIQFKFLYDISALFEKFKYLKISNVAEVAGLNSSLLRQYVTGNKQASSTQAKKIEQAIHKIGEELINVQIHG